MSEAKQVTPEEADRAIFNGDFDHWGSVTVRSGPVVECVVEDCDYLERVHAQLHHPEIVGVSLLRLHLSKCHLADVIATMEGRP